MIYGCRPYSRTAVSSLQIVVPCEKSEGLVAKIIEAGIPWFCSTGMWKTWIPTACGSTTEKQTASTTRELTLCGAIPNTPAICMEAPNLPNFSRCTNGTATGRKSPDGPVCSPPK